MADASACSTCASGASRSAGEDGFSWLGTGCGATMNRYNVTTDECGRWSVPGGIPGHARLTTYHSPQRLKGSSMDKRLCWGSMGVAGIIVLLFLLDLVLRVSPTTVPFLPFGGISTVVDVVGIIIGGLI